MNSLWIGDRRKREVANVNIGLMDIKFFPHEAGRRLLAQNNITYLGDLETLRLAGLVAMISPVNETFLFGTLPYFLGIFNIKLMSGEPGQLILENYQRLRDPNNGQWKVNDTGDFVYLADLPIYPVLALPNRVNKALFQYFGQLYIKDLLEMTSDEVIDVPNIGPNGLEQIEIRLRLLGLFLRKKSLPPKPLIF